MISVINTRERTPPERQKKAQSGKVPLKNFEDRQNVKKNLYLQILEHDTTTK